MKQALGFLAVAIVLHCSHAAAAPPVTLDFDEGVPLVRQDVVRHLVELELRASFREPTLKGTTRVQVRAAAGSQVRIEVNDEITGKSLARSIDLLALGPGGANRLLALAIIELVAASWAELETNPRPVATPVGLRSSPEERRDALATVRERGPRSLRTQVSGLATVDGFFAGTGPLFGGGIRVVPELPHQLALPIDLVAAHGQRSFSVGSVSIDAIRLDVGLAYRKTWSRFGLRAGAGVRGGLVRYAGSPSSSDTLGDTLWAPWVAPMASVSGVFAPVRRLSLELIVDTGYAIAGTGARVNGGDQVFLSGAWIGAALSVGVFAGRL